MISTLYRIANRELCRPIAQSASAGKTLLWNLQIHSFHQGFLEGWCQTRRRRQFRQILDSGEPKCLQEPLSRLVDVWASKFVDSATNGHKIAIEEVPEHFLAPNPPNRLNIGSSDRLPVGHNREGF